MIDKNNTNQKYFHLYATANDSRLYLIDLMNLIKIRNKYSGYDTVFLLIAISKVRSVNSFDRIFIRIVEAMFKSHSNVKLINIFYKSNVGRDFSSYQKMLEEVKRVSSDNDYILFQNRSGYGPFRENWYKNMVEQFEKYDSVAMCGSTINFQDHPSRNLGANLPHVQTYSFLSKMYFMKMLGDNFPAARETDRDIIITKGEIGLSQFFLEKKYKITCLEWPDKVITNQSPVLAHSDMKKTVESDHYFYHRKYFSGSKKFSFLFR